MRRQALALALILGIALALVAGGCGSRKTTLGPDLPPETSVYIQGKVDTANHRVHLYWFGSDPDGNVVAYQMRFVPTKGNPNPKWDTVYCALPGRCTDSVFTLFTGDSALIHTQFEIRAMDDKGLVDPTPAIQRFVLSNLAPRARITNPLRWYPSNPNRVSDSSFASVTVNWDVDDPDGGGPGLHYRIWLDGNQATYDSTTESAFTVPSARFLQGGTYLSGPRTLYLQAVDDGGLAGPLDSTTWFVRAPAKVLDPVTHRGRVLIIDDSRRVTSNSNDLGVDTLYANCFARAASADPYREGTSRYVVVPPGTYSTLRLEYSDPAATLTVRMVEPTIEVIEGDTDVTPDVRMSMSADTADKYWRGEYNVAVGLAKGQVKAKGPVTTILKMVPLTKPLFPVYRELVAEKEAAGAV